VRRKKRRNRLWKRLFWLLVLLGIAAALVIQRRPENCLQGQKEQVKDAPEDFSGMDQGLAVHYLDVGQGDSTLIVCDGKAMLVDAGDNDRGTQIQMYLQKQGVEKLEYVIGTHPDADHIGGLDVILYKFDCGRILMPDCERDTKSYRDVIDTMSTKGYHSIQPEVGEVYTLGSAAFTVVTAGEAREGNINDTSIGILLQYGEKRFLFTGDATGAAEAQMLDSGLNLSADVYKAAHHGSSAANTEAFLEAVDPAYAIISCGTENSYGHPHEEVLERFEHLGVQVLRTDEQGTLVAVSDGEDIQIYRNTKKE